MLICLYMAQNPGSRLTCLATFMDVLLEVLTHMNTHVQCQDALPSFCNVVITSAQVFFSFFYYFPMSVFVI